MEIQMQRHLLALTVMELVRMLCQVCSSLLLSLNPQPTLRSPKKNRAQFLDWTAKLGVESISSEGPERFVHLIARFRVGLCPELQGWVMVGDRS